VLGGTPWQLEQGSVAVVDHVPVPWQEFAQLCAVTFQPTVAITSFTPLRWVAAFAVVDPYPAPWQELQSNLAPCLACPPVAGGMPWQLVQVNVAVGDHGMLPWHEFAQDCVPALQPMLVTVSLMPLRCVAAFTVLAV
jgi:hypothetical protein